LQLCVYAKTDGVDNKTGLSDLPVGRFVDRAVESYFCFPKNISVPNPPKSILELSPSRSTEGRIAIVTDAGWDGMGWDGMRWTRQRFARDGWQGGLRPVSDYKAS